MAVIVLLEHLLQDEGVAVGEDHEAEEGEEEDPEVVEEQEGTTHLLRTQLLHHEKEVHLLLEHRMIQLLEHPL